MYSIQFDVYSIQHGLHTSSSSFGVHPLRMTTSSSSTLKVGFAVAEEANA